MKNFFYSVCNVENNNDDFVENEFFAQSSAHLKDSLKKSGCLILINSIEIASEFLKTYLLSKIGVKGLAASNLINAVTHLASKPVFALSSQNAILIAETFGKIKNFNTMNESIILLQNVENYNSQEIGIILRQGWILGIVSSIPSTIILFFINPILKQLGQPQEAREIAESYFIPYAISLPLLTLVQINERFFSAVNCESLLIPYKFLVTSVGIGFNLLLIPMWGAQGAGFAVLVQASFGLISSTLLLAFKEEFKDFRIINFDLSGNFFYTKNILIQGLPLALSQLVLAGSSCVIALFIGRLGELRLAVDQLPSQYLRIIMSLVNGIGEATNRLVAQAMGAKNFQLLRWYAVVGLFSSELLYVISASIVSFFSLQLASNFLSQEVINENKNLIRCAFILSSTEKIFSVMQDSSSFSLAGMQDTFFSSALIAITTAVVILPLSAIVVLLTDYDMYGIYGAINIGVFFCAAGTLAYLIKLTGEAIKKNEFDPSRDSSNIKFSDCIKSIIFNIKKINSSFDSNAANDDEQIVDEVIQENKENETTEEPTLLFFNNNLQSTQPTFLANDLLSTKQSLTNRFAARCHP